MQYFNEFIDIKAFIDLSRSLNSIGKMPKLLGSNPSTSTYVCEFIMTLSFRLSTKKKKAFIDLPLNWIWFIWSRLNGQVLGRLDIFKLSYMLCYV